MAPGDLKRAASTAVRNVHDPERLAQALRYRASPRWAFVDLGRQLERTVLVTASGRSGSTWLMETLNFDNRYRVVFEPFREAEVPLTTNILYRYIAPQDPAPDVRAVVEQVLNGRLRSRWSDSQNHRRIATQRLVKEIRIGNLVPWISAQFPQVPIIHLLRHPLGVAESRNLLNFAQEELVNWWTTEPFLRDPTLLAGPLEPFADLIDELGSSPDWLARFVLRWCMENYVPVTQAAEHGACFVFYEDLLTEPAAQLRRLFAHLRRPYDPRVLDRLDTPSSHANPKRASQDRAAKLAGWRANLDPGTQADLLGIVDAFGLSFLYGDDVRPQIAPERIVLASSSGGRS